MTGIAVSEGVLAVGAGRGVDKGRTTAAAGVGGATGSAVNFWGDAGVHKYCGGVTC